MGVCLALDRWGGDTHAATCPLDFSKFIAARSRLYPKLENQVAPLPEIPIDIGHRHPQAPKTKLNPVSCKGATSNIFNSCKTIITRIGDKSKPEIGGKRFRTGRSIG